MKYIKFTYVDAQTGISVAAEPAANGPKFPPVVGLGFVWARESNYPTDVPEFFGTCPDESATQIDGVLGIFSQADWEQMQADEMARRPDWPPNKWEALKADRDRRKSGGALVSGKWFHTDADSRIQQLGLVLMGAAVPAVQWKTMDGTFVTMTQALAGGIFQAVAALDMALFSNAETHRAAMEASNNPGSYDFSTGWPAHFVE